MAEFIDLVPATKYLWHDLTRKKVFTYSISKDKTRYLVKISNLYQPDKILGEKSILSLKHPFIIDIKYYTEHDLTGKPDLTTKPKEDPVDVIFKTRFKYLPSPIKFGIITELGSVDLETWMNRVKNQTSEAYQIIKRKFLKQALEGVNFLSKHRIVHNDIKPDNLVIFGIENITDLIYDKGNCCVKLIDFEFAFRVEKDKMPEKKDAIGCIYFSSPEKITQQNYDTTTDLWSLGATFYEVFTGRLLNGSLNDIPRLEYIRWIKDLYLNYEAGFEVECINPLLIKDRPARKIIQQLLSFDPTKRK